MISNSYKELYDLLVSAYGNNYSVATNFTFQTDGTNQLFALPTDFYKLLGVDLQLQAGNSASYVTLQPFNFSQRNRYAVPNFQSFYGVTNLRYRIHGQQLWLTPLPVANQTIQLWYIPEPTTLASDSDSFDGISGWEEYVIVDTVIKAKAKQESDVSVEMAEKQALLLRIQAMGEDRDAGMTATVSDTQYNDYFWPSGSGSGDGSGAW